MTNLVVRRKWFTEQSAIGELYIDGKFQCFTLEPMTPMPCLTYELVIRFSPGRKRLVPYITRVPRYEKRECRNVEIGIGNRPEQDKLIVGDVRGPAPDSLSESTPAFDILFAHLVDQGELFCISFTDVPA